MHTCFSVNYFDVIDFNDSSNPLHSMISLILFSLKDASSSN